LAPLSTSGTDIARSCGIDSSHVIPPLKIFAALTINLLQLGLEQYRLVIVVE
jgi:hypothetical protein